MNNLSFKLAPDAVNPSSLPSFELYTGAHIPAMGMGTFGSDHASADDIALSVGEALTLGYRHFDCASVYANEAEIGTVFNQVLESKTVKRENLWITSKLWNDMHGKGDVLLSCTKTLKDLHLDYLDLYLIHWPFPNHHPPGCNVEERNPQAVPYSHERYMQTWTEMERLVDMGMVRHIGTSNITISKLKGVLKDCRIKPACNEMELHPHFQQPELFDYVRKENIQPIGYSPIGSPARPSRDRTENDSVDIEDSVILSAAKRLNVHPALICLKWAVQRGQIPIPFSTKRMNLLSNLEGITEAPLTEAEMSAIAKIDRNCRLIKGQVFLWKNAQGWEDLWDMESSSL